MVLKIYPMLQLEKMTLIAMHSKTMVEIPLASDEFDNKEDEIIGHKIDISETNGKKTIELAPVYPMPTVLKSYKTK